MIILYVLLGLLGALLLILMIPVVIIISFQEELEIELRALFFFKKKLELDMSETEKPEKKPTVKPKKKKKVAKGEETDKPKEKKSPELEFADLMSMISGALESVSKYMGELLRRFLIYDVELYIAVCDENSAETAIKTGQYNAWIYGIYGLLCNFFRTKNVQIAVTPDFLGEETRINLKAKVRCIPLLVLITALKLAGSLLIKLFKEMILNPKKNKNQDTENKEKERKGGATNEPSN